MSWPVVERGRKVLVVCGWGKGGGFEEMCGVLRVDSSWKVFGFEPNPSRSLDHAIDGFNQGSPQGWAVMRVAAWDRNERVEFTQECDGGSLGGEGSSCIAGFDTGKKRVVTEVRAVDLVSFLDRNTNDRDTVYIRMNMEGAEYPVLRHMLKNRYSFDNVATVWVSFHEDLVPGEDKKSTAKLVQDVRQYCNLKMLYYHA